MVSILDFDDLSIFNNFEEFESIFVEKVDKLQNTDFYFSNNPAQNSVLKFDLNNIFDSSNESEIKSPQNQRLLHDELFSDNFVPFNSENIFIESNKFNLNDKNNSQDTILNFEMSESDKNHILINLEDLNHFEDLSSESDSCKVLNTNSYLLKIIITFFKSEDVILTEEEKSIYLKEGYKIPIVKPLTKVLI